MSVETQQALCFTIAYGVVLIMGLAWAVSSLIKPKKK